LSAICPKCGTPVEQDFGLIQCPQCSSVLSVDVEGHVSIAGQVESSPPVSSTPELPAEIVSPADFSDLGLGELNESELAPLDAFDAVPIDQSTQSPIDTLEAADFAPPIPMDPQPDVDPLAAMDSLFGEDSALPPTSEPQNENGGMPPQSFQDEIAQFGNQTSQIGPISYDLKITGLDGSNVRSQALTLLSDPRFGWDIDLIKSQISKGVLQFQKLNPTVAAVIFRRLMPLDVEFEWSQNV